jgi:hypothetical protein
MADTEELKQDIEATRQNVGRDVDALTDKVSPGRIVDRRVDRVRGRMNRAKDRLMGKAESAGSSATEVGQTMKSAPGGAREFTRGAPLAAGVVAFAAGWVVSAAVSPSARERDLAQQAKDKAVEAATPLKEQAAEAAQEIKDNLQEPAQEAVEQVRKTTTEAAGAVADESRSAARSVADESKNSAASLQQARSSDS